MSAVVTLKGPWGDERGQLSRLSRAFVVSIALHLLIFGTYKAGHKFGWWDSSHLPPWLRSAKMLTELLKKKETEPPKPPQEAPLMFVDVSPAQAVAEAPKNAMFYSDKNSQAANPDATKDTPIPKIDGTQKQVVKTEDVPREKFVPLQPVQPATPPPSPAPTPAPAPPPKAAEPPKPPQEQPKPKPAQPPGDLAMAKPETELRKDDGQTEKPRTRPLTIAEARARQQNSKGIVGEKMRQDGGVRRSLEITSLDAKATPYGAYDEALVEAIQQRWYALLDERDYASDGRGRVVVQFTLQYDGRITGLTVVENSVTDVLSWLCVKAVEDPSPYEPWPAEMRRVLGDVRHIQFTFFYN
jgi:outer membrane biosynthesis protein TonB